MLKTLPHPATPGGQGRAPLHRAQGLAVQTAAVATAEDSAQYALMLCCADALARARTVLPRMIFQLSTHVPCVHTHATPHAQADSSGMAYTPDSFTTASVYSDALAVVAFSE
jgi:hypothetical protein